MSVKIARLDEPAFEIVPLDQQMTATRNANVHTGPGTSYDWLTSLSDRDDVDVTGRTEDGQWYRVALAGGRIGYVLKNLLEEKRAGLDVGDVFRDCPECPEMVVMPAGEFMMGSTNGDSDEQPTHRVSVRQPFAIGKFEVTFAEWGACVAGGGCDNHQYMRGRQGSWPVIFVNYWNAKAYTAWLSRITGHAYRLPSEAEWEYSARAGTTTPYSYGASINSSQANFNRFKGKTAAVGSYPPNAFGLYDMHGNVREWVEDCWNDSYVGAPSDANVWAAGDCRRRVLRGGSWLDALRNVRSADRTWFAVDYPAQLNGFRIARALP